MDGTMMENGARVITDDVAGERKKELIFLALCVLVTILVYANSAFNGFVWDDKYIIANNPINRHLGNIFQVLFSPDVGYQGDSVDAYYRPLNRLSYVIDYQLFGLNPFFYHVENICIHLLNVVLLFRLSLVLFKNAEAAFVTAVVFAVHPINAEAVNFVSGRNNLNAVFFVLLSLLAYLNYQKCGDKSYCLLSAVFFFLGVLCKETAAMVAFVIALHQLNVSQRSKLAFKEKLISLVPFAVASVIYLAMRQRALSSLVWTPDGSAQGIGQRMLQNFYIIPKYFSVLLFPANLNAYYTIPKDYLTHAAWLFGWWLIVVVLVVVAVKHARSAGRFGLLWLVVNFIPISNLVPLPSAPMAERYLYLPAIGLWIIAGASFAILTLKFSLRKVVAPGLIVLVAVLGARTIYRNFVWKNETSLFASMIKAEPNSAFGYYNLGCALKDRGAIVQAQQLWEKALEIEPRHAEALNQLGSIYLTRGFLTKAEEYYNRAVELQPRNVEAQYNLAMTSELLNKPNQAIVHYEIFLKILTPDYGNLIPDVSARILRLRGKLHQNSMGEVSEGGNSAALL